MKRLVTDSIHTFQAKLTSLRAVDPALRGVRRIPVPPERINYGRANSGSPTNTNFGSAEHQSSLSFKSSQNTITQSSNKFTAPNMINMDKTTAEDLMFLFQVDQKQQPRKRRVQFAPVVTALPANRLSHDSWYSTTELSQFKQEARQMIKSSASASSSTATARARGLEYATPQRQRHRLMSIRCTVSAFRKGLPSSEVAHIAQTCSAWSQEAAFLQACHDFAIVYEPSLKQLIPELPVPPRDFPFAMKRCSASADKSDSRRVRRRLAA